ncbi:uncharacterized protein BDR25DRAFT_269930 [Lindgomyces ingoldianus]|uniref:Uncharacterized protein n=1 Tax=Lindgomyces ingoldianus TaxID=673940 RepID=A0ACB6QEI3_9PLEO|nr:uncharacterized protein BDR25DRAFT_269930 [Lindgomyces ingoldianus]KAF2465394.1 hypothetical protein BDR25DRAFT_269930 [Lindgomyces ingoldianus]
MAKKPIPEGWDSNLRPILIFISYFCLCLSLTVFIIGKLATSYYVLAKSKTASIPPRKHVLLFIFLAISSLATTWYHMVRYFQWSYNMWVMWRSFYELTPDEKHWGLWLRHTSLFKEAWEIAIIGHARYWWTHQIFLFACGLGLALEQKGIRRGIKHTWAFMLLGQIVAISFATNLFLLSLLVSPPPIPNRTRTAGLKGGGWLPPWLISALAVLLTVWPAYKLGSEDLWHSEEFMLPLLIPHIALMVLPIARAIVPPRYFTDGDITFSDRVYRYLWITTMGCGVMLWLRETVRAHRYSGFIGIYSAIMEHPAVTSVGWDVICCWISWVAWWTIQQQTPDDSVGSKDGSAEGKESELESVRLGSSVSGNALGGEVRRR